VPDVSAAALRRAVFLDRDGTILEEVGYLNHLSRFQLLDGAASAIRRLNLAAIPVIVVTNQSGVARGFFPDEMVQRVHERMTRELASAGAHVDGIYYCPHGSNDECICRKPRTGMLERAAREHGLDLKGSWMVGDKYEDVALGHAAGCLTVLVMTGYGRGEYEWNRGAWPRRPEFVVEDLQQAADVFLREMK
jgi:D-glycero-D-manno-heptose 1,7-bisphosphate phosphatase